MQQTESTRPTYSVVAPVFNEEQLIAEFCRRTTAVLEQLGQPFEIVLVNDGCRDRSPEIMRELHSADPRYFPGVRAAFCYGAHTAASTAPIRRSPTGKASPR